MIIEVKNYRIITTSNIFNSWVSKIELLLTIQSIQSPAHK